MTNKPKIDAIKMQQELTPNPQMPYRIYYIGKEGITFGGTPLQGKFPWKTSQRFTRRILRAWARDLIRRHDEEQLNSILQKWAKDWSVEYIPMETNPTVVELPTPQRLLGWLRDKTPERKLFFGEQDNERDALMLFHLSEEMIKAMNYCLMREGMRLRIRWEVESLPDGAGIYRILLERGENLES